MSSKSRESITVTKIYEHIKSRKFLEQLCLECIEDVKKKPAYQSLKNMVDRLLSKTIANAGGPSNDAERITGMRMQVAECGMLAYTIDCVVAEVVCNKLEKEYQSMVKEIVSELVQKQNSDANDDRNRGPSESNVNPDAKTNKTVVSSNAAKMGNGKKMSPKSSPKKSSPKKNPSMIEEASKESPMKGKYIIQKVERPNTRYHQEDKSSETKCRNVNSDNSDHKQRNHDGVARTEAYNGSANLSPMQTGNSTNASRSQRVEIVSSPVKSNTPPNSSCKVVVAATHGNAYIQHVISHDGSNAKSANIASAQHKALGTVSKDAKPSTSRIGEARQFLKSEVLSENDDNASPNPESEKDFSVGSVSPVHTSDLSSFDDTISLSGEDERGNSKQKIRLKEANNIFLDGKLPDLYKKKKRGRPQNSLKSKSSSKALNAEEFFSSSEDESPDKATRRLPQRKRKPNSKYASEIYNCQLKMYASTDNSELPTLQQSKRPTFNPASEDIQSIETHSALAKQNGGKSAQEDKSENNAKNRDSVLSTSVSESSARKRGRPKKILEGNSETLMSHEIDSPLKRVRNDLQRSSPLKVDSSPSK